MRWLCALALLCAFPAESRAQAFPTRPVRLVVPLSPGGFADVPARMLAPRLQAVLGRPVVVDNRPGAGGTIGANEVAKATPDGHTLLLVTSTISMNPSVFRKLPYDVERDLVPVTQVIASPFAVLAHPALPVRSVADLVPAIARALKAVREEKRSAVLDVHVV